MAFLLAKPTPLNVNHGNDRFSMFNKKRDIANCCPFRVIPAVVKVQSLKLHPRDNFNERDVGRSPHALAATHFFVLYRTAATLNPDRRL